MTTPLPAHAALETAVAAVELHLAALGEALRMRDTAAIDSQASELHRALAGAAECFAREAARGVRIPPLLRSRLASAGGRVAAQRESLARATAALDRAIEVLLPAPDRSSLYGAHGTTERAARGGGISA